jgi:hypothetical protein
MNNLIALLDAAVFVTPVILALASLPFLARYALR